MTTKIKISTLLSLIVIAAIFSSCQKEDDYLDLKSKKIISIEEQTNNGEIGYTVYFKYDEQDRLIQVTEDLGDNPLTTQYTYEGNMVILNMEYSTDTLILENGIAKSFKRGYKTSTFTYKNGYLSNILRKSEKNNSEDYCVIKSENGVIESAYWKEKGDTSLNISSKFISSKYDNNANIDLTMFFGMISGSREVDFLNVYNKRFTKLPSKLETTFYFGEAYPMSSTYDYTIENDYITNIIEIGSHEVNGEMRTDTVNYVITYEN